MGRCSCRQRGDAIVVAQTLAILPPAGLPLVRGQSPALSCPGLDALVLAHEGVAIEDADPVGGLVHDDLAVDERHRGRVPVGV